MMAPLPPLHLKTKGLFHPHLPSTFYGTSSTPTVENQWTLPPTPTFNILKHPAHPFSRQSMNPSRTPALDSRSKFNYLRYLFHFVNYICHVGMSTGAISCEWCYIL